MAELTFSGHDTFHCRQFWLKKAYDYVNDGKHFNDLNAPLDLGVGKNMVTAMRFWARSFQVIDDGQKTSDLATQLLNDKGWDPYLEDVGTLWLFHYHLVTSGVASIFPLLFNELSRERPEFTAENFVDFVRQRKDDEYNENTLKKDFTVFYRTYFADFKAKDIEEGFTGILTELDLLKQVRKTVVDTDGKTKERELWLIERRERNDIPEHILLYAIIDQNEGRSISFDQLYNEPNQIGSVFALSKEGLTKVLERIAESLDYGITFSNEAGIRELQFKSELNKDKILKDYYGN